MSQSPRVPLPNRIPWTRIKLAAVGMAYPFLRVFLGNAPREIVRNGIRYRVDLSEAIDFTLFVSGHFQEYVTRSPLFTVPDDGVIFDVGANIGSMTLAFAQKVPRGRVFAFEPTHRAFERLQENLSLNPVSARRVTPVQSFVSIRLPFSR